MKHVLMLALAFASSSSALAQFKCTAADGSVTFQQVQCPAADAGERLKINVQPTPEDSRPEYIRRAIAEQKIAIGMTRAELDRVMGTAPDSVNASLFPTGRHDQLVYRQPGGTLYVYTENGVVTAVQSTQTPPAPAPKIERPVRPVKFCPSEADIRHIEIEQSMIANRGNDRLQAELAREHDAATRCNEGR
jgi:hypothetical protein